MLQKRLFDTLDDKKIYAYKIGNSDIEAEIIDYGCILYSLKVRDKNGAFIDVIGGFNTIKNYKKKGLYAHGKTIGRYANRINNGEFSIDGVQYQLPKNDKGLHHLHGGTEGFTNGDWVVEEWKEDYIKLSLSDSDGREGYPGNVNVTLVYSVLGKSLVIDMEAVTDKPTIVNMTNHSYFNLNGDSETIRNHRFKINADSYTAVNDTLIPTGEICKVDGTVYDFIDECELKLSKDIGYDLNYVYGNVGVLKDMATAYSEQSGIKMTIYSNMPCMQFYTTENIDNQTEDKNGVVRDVNSWFCYEPQFAPDSPNRDNFDSPILRPGEVYIHKIVYEFKS